MARDLTVHGGMFDARARGCMTRMTEAPMPEILRQALLAAASADIGATSAPQHHLYAVLEALYGWRAEPMPALQDAVHELHAAAMKMNGLHTVQGCIVRECLALAICIVDGGKAERIGYRIGGLCESLAQLRQGPLLVRELPAVREVA